MAGKYKTKQQSAIKECLEMHKDGYVTVMDIENYLKENDCQVGLTTIYRHLEKMEKDGIVTKFSVEGQPGACFQYIEQGENQDCFYIKCEECGEVTKMECHHLAELYSHVNADHHFSINPKKTIFYGKCEKCGGGPSCSFPETTVKPDEPPQEIWFYHNKSTIRKTTR